MHPLALPFWVAIGWAVILTHGLVLILIGAPLSWLGASTAGLFAVFAMLQLRDYFGWRWPLSGKTESSEVQGELS